MGVRLYPKVVSGDAQKEDLKVIGVRVGLREMLVLGLKSLHESSRGERRRGVSCQNPYDDPECELESTSQTQKQWFPLPGPAVTPVLASPTLPTLVPAVPNCVIMPQGQKRKPLAPGKHHQGGDGTENETERLRVDQAAAAAAAAEDCPSAPVSGGSPPSSLAAGPIQEPQGASAAHSSEASVSCPRPDEVAQSLGEESTSTSGRAAPSALTVRKDHLTKKTNKLVRFLLEKYKMNECIKRSEMIKVVNEKCKQQFPEVLRRASEHMELVFGLEVKEVDSSNESYAFINLLDLPSEGTLSRDRSVPKMGLLMNILSVIFMKGNRAPEEEIWKHLRLLEVYAGRRHAVFGEPKELITKDFVQQNYLEYRQVPGTDPPSYEFLWGPRAKAETTKMKVLEIMARLIET
ncbi:PREDICTED: melanoma-associated antigen B2-like, partial [Hipposideros armiger]|uniref:Melanoma-associated antigen B2-like n=1 Tax=Hipposideros armiger TaxID=186990 RepID=A0A8B7QD60_HIPAR